MSQTVIDGKGLWNGARMPIKAEAERACVIVADAPFAGAPLDCRVQQLHWLIGQLHEIISAIIDVQECSTNLGTCT